MDYAQGRENKPTNSNKLEEYLVSLSGSFERAYILTRTKDDEPMRLFYATDIHGSEKCFRKFLNVSEFYKADVAVLGGDLTGKVIVPVIPLENGGFQLIIQDTKGVQESIAKTRDELNDAMRGLRLNGFYPYETTSQELEELKASREKLERVFDKVIRADLEKWLQLAEERLKDSSVKCFITGGNDDPRFVGEILRRSKVMHDPEGEVVNLGGPYEMLSCGFSNQTPWNAPRELTEDELGHYIDEMATRVKNFETAIFNVHVPPYDSQIDSAPKLDVSVSPPMPIMTGSQYVMAPAGSTAVRSSIEKYAPLAGLFGHIHESKGMTKIGRTLCFNPGSEYSEGILSGYILNTKGTKICYQLVSG